jgi:hypothetical protein
MRRQLQRRQTSMLMINHTKTRSNIDPWSAVRSRVDELHDP